VIDIETKEVADESRLLLWRVKELFGYTVRAIDGEAGKIDDLYVNPKTWNIQAFVVDLGDWVLDTGEWTPGKKFLVPAIAFGQPDRGTYTVSVNLTKDQLEQQPQLDVVQQADITLYSAKTSLGYYIQASDGEIGHLEDFIINDQSWMIRLMIIDTSNWWLGKKVMVEPFVINSINPNEALLYVNISQETVKNSPEFDPSILSNEQL
jgi:sporulation protein YlmC with PRC-barrel domain